jgi:WD40 repeat protein
MLLLLDGRSTGMLKCMYVHIESPPPPPDLDFIFHTPPLLNFIYSVQFDGKLVVSGAYDYLVKVWDPLEGTCLHTLSGHTNRVYSLQVHTLIAVNQDYCYDIVFSIVIV